MTYKLLAIVIFAAFASVTALEITGSRQDLLVDGPASELKLAVR